MWWIRYKATGEILVLNKRVGQPSVLGETVLGYRDRGRAITALRSSAILVKTGLRFADIEFFNGLYTMDEMVTYPVKPGFALRHRVDKWYWNHPQNGRVWYEKPATLESVWKQNERAEAVRYKRKLRAGPDQAKLELVVGDSDGRIEIRPNWFV